MNIYILRLLKEKFFVFPMLLFLVSTAGCKKFIEIDPPKTDLIRATVFESDATAKAAADNMYGQMLSSFAGGFRFSPTFLCGLSSDEMVNWHSDLEFADFASNKLLPLNSKFLYLWDEPYKIIYRANAIIEGLESNTKVSVALNKQLTGEALFVRAFCHFYLLNMFGEIPLILTTDYQANTAIIRTSASVVYNQVVDDLIKARDLLPIDYSTSVSERVRPNKGTASALLARTYLYMTDWSKAEQEAASLITNTALYAIEPLNNVFLKQSREAIWQLGKITGNANESALFNFPVSFNCSLTDGFVLSFESNDNRKTAWMASANFGIDYYYPVKYSTPSSLPVIKHSIVFRLAEQYLIRAEARAQQNKITEAQADINTIRQRAGLGNTPAADKASLLLAIEQERRHELFTEWGDRWFDLKRTGKIDAVLEPVKPGWQSYKALYPLPEWQIQSSPGMSQNPGY